MAIRKKSKKQGIIYNEDAEMERPIDEAVEAFMTEYGIYTLENRAIPSVEDGLMPVQRRSLWSMKQLGLSFKSAPVKHAKVVGECFKRGTKVSTPNGLVNIEDLQIGDAVITSQGIEQVEQTFHNPATPLLELELSDGKKVILTYDQEVKVRIDEQFFWKKAQDLIGDDIIIVEG